MNLKKLLLLLIMQYTIFSIDCSTHNISKDNHFKKYFEEQKEHQEKIIQLLTLNLQLQAEKIQAAQRQEDARQAALQKESEKGFSFTECGIVIRDTFLEEFNLRAFSLEFCQGIIKTFKRLVLNKAIQETFNGVDYTFGVALTRHVHPQAGIYPVTFLQSNSFGEYTRQRKTFIEQEDPRVTALHNEADALLKEANLTIAQLKAQERLKATQKTIEQEDPRVTELEKLNNELLKAHGINPSLAKEEERQKEIIKQIGNEHPLVKTEKQKQNSILLESGYVVATQVARNDTAILAETIRNAQHEQKNNPSTNSRVEVMNGSEAPSAHNEKSEN